MAQKKGRKKEIIPDPLYNDIQVAKFINHVMRNGKKSVAQKIVYKAFDIVKETTKKEALEVFNQALENASPYLEVRARRVGGATYQVPFEVKGTRRLTLAMRWIVAAAKSKKGKAMEQKLAQEITAASNNSGDAVNKKENLRKIAESNRAFAHLAW